jgi:hypothetical protein
LSLETAVVGLKMAHLPKIALAFEFLSARPTVPGLEASEKFKILRAFEHLHHFDRPSPVTRILEITKLEHLVDQKEVAQ